MSDSAANLSALPAKYNQNPTWKTFPQVSLWLVLDSFRPWLQGHLMKILLVSYRCNSPPYSYPPLINFSPEHLSPSTTIPWTLLISFACLWLSARVEAQERLLFCGNSARSSLHPRQPVPICWIKELKDLSTPNKTIHLNNKCGLHSTWEHPNDFATLSY